MSLFQEDDDEAQGGRAQVAVLADEQKAEKRAQRRRASKLKADQSMTDLARNAERADVIAAFDMSARSPALTIIDRRDSPAKIPVTRAILEKWLCRNLVELVLSFVPTVTRVHMVCFAQTIRQFKCAADLARPRLVRIAPRQITSLSKSKAGKRRKIQDAPAAADEVSCIVSIDLQPLPKGLEKDDGDGDGDSIWCAMRGARRNEWLTDLLIRRLEAVLQGDACRVITVIEAYAFHIQSSSVTVLAELGGVIRNKLVRAGLPFVEVSPTTVKRWFTGSGAADKHDMWRRFQAVTAGSLPLDDLIPGSFEKNIPSPHSDVVDSFALAFSLYQMQSSS